MTNFILFGSTGDLARLKIIPQLIQLKQDGLLPEEFVLLAVGRRAFSTIEYLEYLRTAETHPVEVKADTLAVEYVQVDFDSIDGFQPLFAYLDRNPDAAQIFYLAIGPEIMPVVKERFCDSGKCYILKYKDAILATEKPFGVNYQLAVQLNHQLKQLAKEEQIYRIDHYLFKDTSQKILEYRREHNLFGSSFWSNVTKVEVIASEDLTVGSRAGYYDKHGGAVNDWLQSHLLQLLALAATDCFQSDIQQARAEIIKSLQLREDGVIIGQYAGYQAEVDVNKNSQTETFVAATFDSRLEQLQHVKFLLSSGKGLKTKDVHITYHFKDKSQLELVIDAAEKHSLLGKNKHDAYYYVIDSLLQKDSDKFISLPEIQAQWEVTDQINSLKQNLELKAYPIGTNIHELISSPSAKFTNS